MASAFPWIIIGLMINIFILWKILFRGYRNHCDFIDESIINNQRCTQHLGFDPKKRGDLHVSHVEIELLNKARIGTNWFTETHHLFALKIRRISVKGCSFSSKTWTPRSTMIVQFWTFWQSSSISSRDHFLEAEAKVDADICCTHETNQSSKHKALKSITKRWRCTIKGRASM